VNGVHQEAENEENLNSPGRKGLEDWWEKGIGGGRLERQTLEEEDNMINRWAQEDVNTLYSLLNNTNLCPIYLTTT
jgi:hypothetical protein